MFKSIAVSIATVGLGLSGASSAFACGGGSCGASTTSSVPSPPVATAASSARRFYTYEPGYQPSAPSFGRPMTGGYGNPSFGNRPADAKPLGRLP
jgi:hypothetical protein